MAFQATDEGSIPFARLSEWTFEAWNRRRAGTTSHGFRPTMRITIDRASGGYRVHVWMTGSDELLFWSDIYASKQGAQRAAYHLKAHVGNAPVEDMTGAEISA